MSGLSPACAALLASLVPGLSPNDIDRSRVYDIPVSAVAHLDQRTIAQAKACARENGIRWKIVGR